MWWRALFSDCRGICQSSHSRRSVSECAVNGPCAHHQHRTLPASLELPGFTGGRTRPESAVHEPGWALEGVERLPTALLQLPLEGVDHLGRVSGRIQDHLQVREQPLVTYDPASHQPSSRRQRNFVSESLWKATHD